MIEPEIFDSQSLHEYFSGDIDFIKQMLAVFLEEVKKRLDELDLQLKAKDFEGVRLSAHSIKGSANNAHAQRLSAAAQDLVEAARSGNETEIRRLAQELPDRYSEVCLAIAIWKAGL